MNYKNYEKKMKYFLNIFLRKNLKKIDQKNYKENPFGVLKNLNLRLKICFLKKRIKENNYLVKVAALLIHAAKIDENYS